MFTSLIRNRWSALFMLILLSLSLGQVVAAQDNTQSTDCTPNPPADWVVYLIQPGDTLSGLAARTDSTVEELARVNCITNRRLIVNGTRLFVPKAPAPADPIDQLLERCRAAGLSAERCRALFSNDDNTLAERCRNAGLSAEECRRIINGNQDGLLERCLAAGLTTERCRAIFSNDDNTLAERCRNAGLTPQECRRIINGQDDEDDDNNLPERCRNAGLSTEECRRLYNASQNQGDDNTSNATQPNQQPTTTDSNNRNRRG